MSDELKLLTKKYMKRHPVKSLSSARLEYAMLLMPEALDLVEENMPKLRAMGVNVPDTTELMEQVKQEEDTTKLLRMLRKELPLDVRIALRKKLLKREAEALPEIQRMILKAFNVNTIENCVQYMVNCEANCSEWILRHFNEVYDPYARSMLCLVLGFRSDTEAIPFLMQQVEHFEKRFPDEDHEQGPLMALHEIRKRFGQPDQQDP